jgi:hypothetical protein
MAPRIGATAKVESLIASDHIEQYTGNDSARSLHMNPILAVTTLTLNGAYQHIVLPVPRRNNERSAIVSGEVPRLKLQFGGD